MVRVGNDSHGARGQISPHYCPSPALRSLCDDQISVALHMEPDGDAARLHVFAWLKVKQPHYRAGERGWQPNRKS